MAQRPPRPLYPQAPRREPAVINLPAWSELLDITGTQRVLEVGCGDCTFLAALAPLVGELVGLEFSAPGAVGAHETLRGLSKPSALFIGQFLDFHDRSGFDAILIRRGLQTVRADQRLAWARHATTLLRPEGVLYLADDEATPEAAMMSSTSWHAGLVAAGLIIRREVMKVPAGLELLALKPDAAPRTAAA